MEAENKGLPEAPPLDEEKRKLGIGASEIAAVLGLSRYEDPFTIYGRKTGELTQPDGLTQLDIKRRMGRVSETELLQLYTEITGRKLIRPGTLVHPKRPWQVATPDGLVIDERRGVEGKTAGYRQAHLWGDPDDPAQRDRVPTEYFLQCQWGISVTGSEAWDLAAWIGSETFGIYTIEPDSELIEMMLAGALDFCEKHLWPRVPPPIGWTPESSEWIKQKYPRDVKGKVIVADSRLEALALRLFALKKIEDVLGRISEWTKNRVKELMGDAGTVAGTGWEIRWRKNKDSLRTDWEAAAKEMQTTLLMIGEATKADPIVYAIAMEAALNTITNHTKTVPGNRPFGKHWLPEKVFLPRMQEGTVAEFVKLAELIHEADPVRLTDGEEGGSK